MKRGKRARGRRVRDTRARVALAEWLASDPKRTQTSLADRLRVEQPLISQWLKGTARPGPKLRAAIEGVCGIAQNDWLDASERVDVQQMRAAV